MIVGLLIVAALAFLFCIVLGIRDGIKKGAAQKQHKSQATSPKETMKLKAGMMMGDTFNNIGWFSWDASVHFLDGQAERIERAATDHSIKLLEYDSSTGAAAIRGTTGDTYSVSEHRCTCGDFRARGLPCKHIYLLAMELDNT